MLSTWRLSIKFFGVCAGLLFFVASFVSSAEAMYGIPSDIDLDGFAWSSNIGWISMNCRTGSATSSNICATSNYKVTVQTTGNLIGYAWSSNIGWIRFNGLSNFPTGTGNVAFSSRVRLGSVYPNLTYEGWIRACAGTNSVANTCSSMTNSTTSGAWDGWISLRGTTPTYNSTSTDANFTATSFGWGSSVVGWVSFDPVSLLVPGATLSATDCRIPLGGNSCNSTTTWTFTNALGVNIYNFTTGISYFLASSSGTNQLVPLREGTNRIQSRTNSSMLREVLVNATCATGLNFSNGISCQPNAVLPPTISININGKNLIRVGETVSVNWVINPPPVSPCNIYGPGITRSTSISGTAVTSAINNSVVMEIICTGAFGTVQASTRVDVIPRGEER